MNSKVNSPQQKRKEQRKTEGGGPKRWPGKTWPRHVFDPRPRQSQPSMGCLTWSPPPAGSAAGVEREAQGPQGLSRTVAEGCPAADSPCSLEPFALFFQNHKPQKHTHQKSQNQLPSGPIFWRRTRLDSWCLGQDSVQGVVERPAVGRPVGVREAPAEGEEALQKLRELLEEGAKKHLAPRPFGGWTSQETSAFIFLGLGEDANITHTLVEDSMSPEVCLGIKMLCSSRHSTRLHV